MNQPGGQKQQCSFQCKNPWMQPSEADTKEAKEHRKFAIALKRRRKWKEKDLRVKILKKNTKKRFRVLHM
jgi:hypothetical protein